MQNLTHKFALVYTDEGPGGPCGQSCYTTSKWTRVYLFKTEAEALKWLNLHEKSKRKRPDWQLCELNNASNPNTLTYL